MEFKWELISSNNNSSSETYRAQTIGGWLVIHIKLSTNGSESMQFIPDPNHEWQITNEE